MEIKKCENCGVEIDGTFASGRFCCLKCSNSYNGKRSAVKTKGKDNFNPLYKTEEWKKRCSESQKKVWQNEEFRKKLTDGQKNRDPKTLARGEPLSKAVGKSTKGKHKGDDISSILDVSKRTVAKILKRMKLGCSVCGWKECACDVHHINGRDVENADEHWNLTYLCPNCHRMAHNNAIDKENLITLDLYLPENWKDFYYG